MENIRYSNLSGRPTAVFHPSLWGDYFITSIPLPSKCQESEAWMKQRVETLILEVKEMLSSHDGPYPDMYLIDALQRLGVDYHFEKEIGEALSKLHDVPSDDTYHDLQGVALRFRLLRQHRYDVPCDVFEKFKDGHGNFTSSIASDVKGLLSLYEAAYLAKQGEDILDEALRFAKGQLESMATHLEPHLKNQVLHSLETPLRRKLQRLEARQYISLYEQDHELRKDTVLELAKLDFHLLQGLHQQELRTLCMWQKKWFVPTKLAFARDRIVELFYCALGFYFEPHYSRARIILTKVVTLLSVMDDLYDNYGTLDELQQYTGVLQRWNLEDADKLEDCCKLHFLALSSTIEEIEGDLASEESYRIHYLKEVFKEANRAHLVEARWREERHVPSFDEHLSVSLVSSTYAALCCASFIGMGDVVTKEALDWFVSFPNILKSACLIGRLMNDVVSHEFEKQRDHVASLIDCHMKDHGASIQEASDKLLAMVEESWKDINKEMLDLVDVKTPLLLRVLNVARLSENFYRKNDDYTNSLPKKEHITLLLVLPIDF